MAVLSETYRQWGGDYARDFLTLHPYDVWDPYDFQTNVAPYSEFGIQAGEDIGIHDYSLPVGTGAFLPQSSVGIGSTVGTIAVLSQVAGGSTATGSTVTVTREDGTEAEFPEGSIFAPGDIWGSDNRESDFPDPDVTGPDPDEPPGVFIPIETGSDVGGIYEPRGEVAVAIDWGDLARGVINAIDPPTTGFVGTTTPVVTGTTPGGANPADYYIDPKTGMLCKKKRRRRRRLLTPTDLSDLAALQALVGKGSSALNMAVAKAVRR